MAIDVAKIRNLGLVGHGGVGKTSLVEAILHAAGATTRLGRVDDGTTVTDSDPDEIKRKITISTAVAHCDWKGHRLHLVDTPGYGDFVADARAGLRVVEGAIVVVCGVAGVEVQTEKVWRFANDYSLPRLAFVNRLDRERADFFRALDSMQRRLKGRLIPIQLPIGAEAGFKGVVDLVKMKAYLSEPGSRKIREEAIPGDLSAQVQEYRDKLVEAVAETDDELLAKYLEEGSLDEGAMLQALRKAITEGKVIPVLCGSATKLIGIAPLLDLILESFPSPADRPAVEGTDAKTKQPGQREPSAKAPLSALVFKTVADPHVGKMTLFRVYSGTLTPNSQLYNSTRQVRERVGQVAVPQGKEQKPVELLGPGEIGVVAKLKETVTGDTLSDEAHAILFPPITFPEPPISFAIQPKARGDEEKISSALARLAEEDPALRYHYSPETKQLLVSGLGQLHIEVTVDRMKRKFGTDVTLLPPRVPYRETITRKGDTEYTHKKQTGGAGQYAKVFMRVEPLPRGGGFVYDEEIRGGSISQQYIPSIEKGIHQVLEQGVLAGYPIVDVKAVVYDGKMHPVDSKDIAFQIAGREVFKLCVEQASPVLLEPIMTVEVTLPTDLAGDVIGDLNSRRGRILGMDPMGETTSVRAQVPMAEMLNYEPQLRSMSGGRGSYSMELAHYEEVPAHLATRIVAEAKAEREKAQAEKH